MDRQEAIQFLTDATAAYAEVKRTADACLEHCKTCKVCRSKVRSTFFQCHDAETLALSYAVAKTEADSFGGGMARLKLELMGPSGATTEWCESLYALEDNRSGKA